MLQLNDFLIEIDNLFFQVEGALREYVGTRSDYGFLVAHASSSSVVVDQLRLLQVPAAVLLAERHRGWP
jgi:hypothetical protein